MLRFKVEISNLAARDHIEFNWFTRVSERSSRLYLSVMFDSNQIIQKLFLHLVDWERTRGNISLFACL